MPQLLDRARTGTDTTVTAADAPPPAEIRARDIVCFSHDWTGDPLSKTHLMRLLAKHNRILWVNSIGYRAPTASARDVKRAFRKLAAAVAPVREVEPNIHVLNPLVIPAYGKASIRRLNQKLLRFQVKSAMRKLRFQRPMNWVFNPAAGMIAGTLGEEQLIYYCVDEYTALSGVPTQSMAQIEAELLRKADLVVVSADRLLQAKKRTNPTAVLVRHGVDFTHFRKALDPSTVVPAEIVSLGRPLIGYFGLIASDWIDLPLLCHVAENLPAASIVMLGKTTMDVSALAKYPNVRLLGRKPYESLPAYCKGFDVALIPFPINEATLHSNPLKAREYLAAGLPVVSTAIPEVEVLNCCRIGRNPQEFVEQIRQALVEPGPSAQRSELMREHSWEARLADVSHHLQAITGRQD
jgi:glycosyltransferase involved in cell wall biosynthesis